MVDQNNDVLGTIIVQTFQITNSLQKPDNLILQWTGPMSVINWIISIYVKQK